MVTINNGILILTPFFPPNIGGVETHLTDLINQLNQRKKASFVITYSPLTTNITYKTVEKIGYCQVVRLPWIGKGLFHSFEKIPILDFLYITPYLLIANLLWMTFNHHKIKTIHSQGINAAFIGNILSFIFHKRHLVSTHAIYENINKSTPFVTNILNQANTILCLSNGSKRQLTDWGIASTKLHLYRYWTDTTRFTPAISIPKKFTVLFSGRLIKKKGVLQLLKVAQRLPSIDFLFVGAGPLSSHLNKFKNKYKNINYLGQINYSEISNVYRQASILCIPSIYPEGYGRVSMEAVASGLPVVGSYFGSISEAVNHEVSILVRPSQKNLKKAIKKIASDKKLFLKMRSACRPYALKHFSSKNFQLISRHYD